MMKMTSARYMIEPKNFECVMMCHDGGGSAAGGWCFSLWSVKWKSRCEWGGTPEFGTEETQV